MKKTDIQNRVDVETLVNSFYEKVRDDEMLAPIFNEKIHDWQPHLNTMYQFWSSILLDESSYRGQPFFKHVNLKIDLEHFNRWLDLFYQTLDEFFEGPTTDLAKERASSIANVFYTRIMHIRAGKTKIL